MCQDALNIKTQRPLGLTPYTQHVADSVTAMSYLITSVELIGQEASAEFPVQSLHIVRSVRK